MDHFPEMRIPTEAEAEAEAAEAERLLFAVGAEAQVLRNVIGLGFRALLNSNRRTLYWVLRGPSALCISLRPYGLGILGNPAGKFGDWNSTS